MEKIPFPRVVVVAGEVFGRAKLLGGRRHAAAALIHEFYIARRREISIINEYFIS